MAAIQLGWTLSGRLRANIARDTFLNNVDEGFKIIDGHFDSAWLTDHLQYDAGPVYWLLGISVPNAWRAYEHEI